MKGAWFFLQLLGISHCQLSQFQLQSTLDYLEEVQNLDFEAVKDDIARRMVDSDPAFPADQGTYAGLFIRLAWHCAGTYRVYDGEGGCSGGRQRFWPEQSWGDNVNLDKARNLLEPIKQKYGVGLSYGDLYVIAGTVAIERSGGRSLGFCAGRIDDFDGTESLIFGPSDIHSRVSPCSEEANGNCSAPMGATNMELIYVDAAGFEGAGNPDTSVSPIKDSFGRMGMNTQETVILIGGGHGIGKTHGACPDGPGPSPREQPDDPWPTSTCPEGVYTSGFEGPWTVNPSLLDNTFFTNLLAYGWEAENSPAGNPQFQPTNATGESNDVRMLTTDISLLRDSEFMDYVRLYAEDSEAFYDDFAAAWYKLTTRDMGPRSRCFGSDVPENQGFQGEDLAWTLNDRVVVGVNPPDWDTAREEVVEVLESSDSDIGDAALATEMAYLCAATFRVTDFFGGCNGARILWEPERSWPDRVGIESLARAWMRELDQGPREWMSAADMIVFVGSVALAEASNGELELEFCPGRKDAISGSENLEIFKYDNLLIQMLREIRLLGLGTKGFVALMARPRSVIYYNNLGYSGVYPGAEGLSNEYFQMLLSESWVQSGSFVGALGGEYVDLATGTKFITERDYNLILDPELKAFVSYYASDAGLFMEDFATFWTTLMNADRFDGPVENACQNGQQRLYTVSAAVRSSPFMTFLSLGILFVLK